MKEGDAHFVDAIHTGSFSIGTFRRWGHADFYVGNAGEYGYNQPKYNWSENKKGWSHYQAIELYTQTIKTRFVILIKLIPTKTGQLSFVS